MSVGNLSQDHENMCAEILGMFQDLKLCKFKFKNEFWKYLKIMYKISLVFHENFKSDALRRVAERQQGKGLCLFNLVPITKLRAGGISIQSVHLYEIMQNIKQERNHLVKNFPSNRSKFLDERQKWWKLWLNFSKFERVASGKRFAFSINTDGVSISLNMKQTVMANEIDDYGVVVGGNEEYQPLEIGNRLVVGLDPGKSQVFTAVSSDNRKTLMSLNQWSYLLGEWLYKKKIKMLKKLIGSSLPQKLRMALNS